MGVSLMNFGTLKEVEVVVVEDTNIVAGVDDEESENSNQDAYVYNYYWNEN